MSSATTKRRMKNENQQHLQPKRQDWNDNKNNNDDDDNNNNNKNDVVTGNTDHTTITVLPISDVVYNLVAPAVSSTATVDSSSTTSTQCCRYQFRHSIQIQKRIITTTTTAAAATTNSTATNTMNSVSHQQQQQQQEEVELQQTISTGDVVVIEYHINNTNSNDDDDHSILSSLSLMKHYQKIIPDVPPQLFQSQQKQAASKSKQTTYYRIGVVLGFVTLITSSSSSSKSTTTATAIPSLLQEEYHVIISWLIPYTYIQEHDNNCIQQQHHHSTNDNTTTTSSRSSSCTYLDKGAYQTIRKSVRPDGMLFRIPPSTNNNTNSCDTSNNNNNIEQLYTLFGPQTIPVQQIVLGTMVSIVSHTQYHDTKQRNKYHPYIIIPIPPSIDIVKNNIMTQQQLTTTSKKTKMDTSTTTDDVPHPFHCYEYTFHCHYALPIVETNDQSGSTPMSINAIKKEAVRCLLDDLVPQQQSSTTTTTNGTTNTIVPPKMAYDAWNLLLLHTTTKTPFMNHNHDNDINNNNNLLQHVMKHISPTIRNALIYAMTQKSYPIQQYNTSSSTIHDKFQYHVYNYSNISDDTKLSFSIQQPAQKGKRPMIEHQGQKAISQSKKRKIIVDPKPSRREDDDNESDFSVDGNTKIIPTAVKKKATTTTKRVTLSPLPPIPVDATTRVEWCYDKNEKIESVYDHHLLATKPTTTNKYKKSKMNTSKLDAMLYFYSQVDLIQQSNNNHRMKNSKKSKSLSQWTIHVGDVIAVALHDNDTSQLPPIYTSTTKQTTASAKFCKQKQSPWYPLNQPWCPAQILAIYEYEECNNQRKDNKHDSSTNPQLKIQIRWFYRPKDLPEEIVEEMSESFHHDLFGVNGKDTKSSFLISGRQYIEVDEDVEEVTADHLIGPISITSNPNHLIDMLQSYNRNDRDLLAVPILCRYMLSLLDCSGVGSLKQLRSEHDWSEYSSVHDIRLKQHPFRRGLKCPKSYPGRILPLFNAYGGENQNQQSKQAMVGKQRQKKIKNGEYNLDQCSDFNDDDDDHDSNVWPDELLSLSDATSTRNRANERVISIVEDSATRTFREHILSTIIQVHPKRCDPRATAKKSVSSDGRPQWQVRIGDVVAIACNGARKSAVRIDKNMAQKDSRNRWYPFLGPWRACQVLNIYRNVTRNDTLGTYESSGTTFVEVRWLLRQSDLSPRVWDWMPPNKSSQQGEEETYESDDIEKDIPVNHILGYVALYFADQSSASNHKDFHTSGDIPGAFCRCRYFYSALRCRFQPLFCSETTPRRWFQRFVYRGFKLSPMTQFDHDLRQGIELCLDLQLSDGKGLFQEMLMFDGQELDSSREKMFLNSSSERKQLNREYFLSTTIRPVWSKMMQPDFVCPEIDRKSLRWTIRVGDIVAIEISDVAIKVSGEKCYPYNVPWRVVQVLSIYRNCDATKSDDRTNLNVQVRSFYRTSENEVLRNTATTLNMDIIYSSNEIVETPCRLADILGPVTLLPGSEQDLRSFSSYNLWDTVLPYLPPVLFTYAGHFDAAHQQKIVAPKLLDIVRNGVELSNHYDLESRQHLLHSLYQEAVDLSSVGINLPFLAHLSNNVTYDEVMNEESILEGNVESTKYRKRNRCTVAWTAIPPFYTDSANHIEYFTELEVEPPWDAYSTECIDKIEQQKRVWTIKLGDAVIVHHEVCAGRAAYHASAVDSVKALSSLSPHFPFIVPWAVAEVVHIKRKIKNVNESSDVILEVRWLYRRKEIPAKSISDKIVNDLETEEICESDHYDDVITANLLAPVKLYESPQSITIGSRYNGMPQLEFHCYRFWSVHRKSLKPIGGSHGRVERGRLQSKSTVNDRSLREALLSLSKTSINAPESTANAASSSVTFNEAFMKVIQKLSLTDASKDAHANSAALIGREKERKEISSFLRSSIAGKGQAQSGRGSLFIAGPPGTGKTASVLAVISDLQREQSISSLPGFDFISLNGMEMRDPFEAYVKLWTQLEGESSRCNADQSASRLEAYFTGKYDSDDDVPLKVSVVLLDEIDYLVTKKQSVLYNFFDWPTRSLETKSNRRLVVIGVSNTLNLPERLHPRVQSRIGSKRVFFKSYSVNETVTILNSKLQQASPNYTVFDSDAILYASKKTAALSGDIRKAFHICRSAAEMILYEAENSEGSITSPIVRIKDVLKVSRESTNAAQPRSVGLCAPYQVLLLVALAALSKTTGREYGGFDVEEITTKMRSMADAFGDPMYLPPPTLPETLLMISRLYDSHLIAMASPRDRSLSYRASLAGSGGPWPLVSMVMDDLAILLALKETPHSDLAQKFLSRSSF